MSDFGFQISAVLLATGSVANITEIRFPISDFRADALGGGGGQQDAVAVMSVGQPQAGIFEPADLRLMGVGAGAKADPGSGSPALRNCGSSLPARLAMSRTISGLMLRSKPTVSMEEPA